MRFVDCPRSHAYVTNLTRTLPMDPPDLIPLPLNNIRMAYHQLGHRVLVALRTQLGDSARLQEHANECYQLLSMVEQVRASNLQCIHFVDRNFSI
jgi:hypothetical protein